MANEKLIFPIGFDLEEGVKEASKEWKSTYQKQLQKAIDDKPLKVKIDFESKGIDTKEFKQWMALSREAEKLERERIKNAREWQKVADQQAMAETRRANATNESNARIERQNRKAEASERRKRDAVERTNEAYKRQGGYLQRLFQRMVAYASVTQAFSFIRNIREVTAQFELQRMALGSIIGDLNEANAMFEQIKAAAVKSPFQIKELVTYTKQLAAYGFEQEQLFDTTMQLADISAGLGVGMERLALFMGQVRATGYLRASEVRQATEAGIPLVEQLAKKMSQLRGETVSAAEVMGMISERAISFGMVKEVFDDMTSAGGMFYKMQEKQAETLAGQWSNLQDAISIMYEEIGNTETAQNGIKGMIGLVKSLAENWRDVYSVAQSLSVAMGVYYVAMKNATVASKALSVAEATRLSTLRATTVYMPKFLASTKLATTLTRAYRVAVIKSATATGLLSKSFWKLTAAMLSNPYTAVLAVLASLATLLLTTENRAKRLNKELAKIGTEGALQAGQSVRNFERLAKAVRESADGSEKQTTALAELKRSYGDLLPSQDKEIKALVQEKANYDSLIKSIKRKIELQIQEQKINKIASEYGSRISKAEGKFKGLLTQYGLTEEDADRVTDATKKAIDEGLISAQKSAKENARELSRILEEETGLTKLKDYFDPMVVFTERYGQKMRSQFGALVEVVSEYNTEIDKVGGALDKLDDKGKNLADTFNTWQKELKAITAGKNLKGEGIRLFDDESITQINKLTDATARVAEEYDKLAKEKKEVDKALLSEGAKADKQTYSQLEQRLGKINEGMSGLYDFLKKYGGLDLIKDGDKDGELARLQKELQLHEKIYAKYKEYRKYMSAEEAKAKVEDYFGDTIDALKFKPSFDKSGYQNVLEQYKKVANTLLAKAKDETEKAAIKKFLLDIGFKIDDKDWEETKDDMEKNLKKLSDDLSRTKTAKEFFDRMLGMTGDKELSATLTMSVYGEGENVGKNLAEQTIEQLETAFEGVNISRAIDKATNKVDYAKLAPLVKQLPEEAQENAQALVDAGIKANADWLIDLQKTYQKAFTFEERRTQVMNEEAQKRKEIEESTLLDDTAKKRYTEASKKREAERISAINLEEFKASEDYIKMFEDLDRLATPTIQRLIGELRKFIETNNNLDATELKNLTEQINKLEESVISRNPIEGLVQGFKRLRKAREKLNAKASRDEEKYTNALDEEKEAYKDIEQGLNGLQNKFSQVQSLVSSFADTLGASEDTKFGAVLGDISDALGGVSKAFNFAQIAVKLFDGSIKSMLKNNPIGWILLSVSAIVAAVQAVSNAKIRRIDNDIEALNDRLDSLSYAYGRLQKDQEKVFGTEYIQNYQRQLENLEAQKEAYLKQAEEERSKGKKADEDKIKEYERQAQDAADAIADMYGSLSTHFLGTDITSAARDFAQAWIEAYKEFSNTTDAMKAKFQDMIQNMVVESLLAKVMERALEPVFTMIDEMQDGDFYSTSFWQGVMDKVQKATTDSTIGAENIMSMLEQMGINLRGLGGEMTGISRDIATASEESVLGLAAGINTQNFYISQVPTKLDTIIGLLRGDGAMPQGSTITLQDVMIAQNQFLSHLPTIAQHTAETVAKCEQIVAETRRTADALERVIKPDGTRTPYKLNVVTTYQG